MLREQKGWEQMHKFVASSKKYLRTHEAAALNEAARRALVCVEEAAVHEAASRLAGNFSNSEELLPFVR